MPAAGTARGRQTHVLPQEQARFLYRGGEVVLDHVTVEAAVGHQLVEVRHHVGLRHHWKAAEIGELDAVRIQAAEPGRVKRRVCDGVCDDGHPVLTPLPPHE